MAVIAVATRYRGGQRVLLFTYGCMSIAAANGSARLAQNCARSFVRTIGLGMRQRCFALLQQALSRLASTKEGGPRVFTRRRRPLARYD